VAIGTHYRPEKDLLVIPDWSGPGGLNPCGWEYQSDGQRKPVMGSAVVMDAT
jgi:hypothetical protein|tara:strand:- start:210 stop:365 length:156 start_codon:yes stop_codon:yes gene_type:complete